MQASDYIAIALGSVSIVISVISGVYTIATNSKRYELAEQYKCEILAWYEKVVVIIMRLTAFQSTGGDAGRKELCTELAELSALIEVGRFYFPNIDKHDGYGKDKPVAYHGYRHMALDFLVYIYQIYSKDSFVNYKKQIVMLEREFTSCVFELVAPNRRRQKLKKYTDLTMPADKTLEDFLSQTQRGMDYFWHT